MVTSLMMTCIVRAQCRPNACSCYVLLAFVSVFGALGSVDRAKTDCAFNTLRRRMTEAKTSAHVKSSIVLTDDEEVSFASVFADMFTDDRSCSITSSAAESASRVDHRGATSVEFCFGSIRMPMHANSDEVTKLQGHISALVWRSSLLASSIICGCTSIPKLDNAGNREIFSRIFGNSDSVECRLQERFLQLLQRKGFGTVLSDSGPWDFDLLVQQHIRRNLLDKNAPCVATTGHEQNGPHVILVSWR